MDVCVLKEHGYDEAMLGLSLSYGQDPERMPTVANRLAFKGDGHSKFLESMVVWLDINAARYWWSHCDTYRAGISKQSQSTMHTITKHYLTQSDFEHAVLPMYLDHLNTLVTAKDWQKLKWDLPESFLQRRIVCLNYAVLQRIIRQRRTHKLIEWTTFIEAIMAQVEYPEFLEAAK